MVVPSVVLSATLSRILGALLVIVRRPGDYGAKVGDTTVSPRAPVSHFLKMDDVSRRVVSGGLRTTEAKVG